MNVVDGTLSMRSLEPCGLVLAMVYEYACASYSTAHEQSRQYTCYTKCAYLSAGKCVLLALGFVSYTLASREPASVKYVRLICMEPASLAGNHSLHCIVEFSFHGYFSILIELGDNVIYSL